MFEKKSVKDVDLKGKKVLMRVDFNVPIENSEVGDDTRIVAAIPTIKYILKNGAALILCSHLGRPKGTPDTKFSLLPVSKHLGKLLGCSVLFAEDCIGSIAETAAKQLQPGGVLLLENTRFHIEETENDPEFAKKLASLADIFVNDAFGAVHRAHASTEGVTHYLPSVAGLLLEKEIQYLGNAVSDPKRPFVAIMGGAKISDKIGVINNLLKITDCILIGGGMANTFFKAQGYPVGDSLVEDSALETATELLQRGNQKLQLPVDIVIADKFENEANTRIIQMGIIPDGWRILDIGPETISKFSKLINKAATIVWNGPMGVFEFPSFAKGTFGIANAIAESEAVSIIGGGESVAAIKKSGLSDKITHISTGGGASLEMLEGIALPGVVALQDK